MHWAQRAVLIYLGALSIAIWGYGVGEHHWWPYQSIKELSEFIEGDPEEAKTTVLQKLQNDLGGHPHRKLIEYNAQKAHPERAYQVLPLPNKRDRRLDPLIYQSKNASPALRLIYGSFDHKKGINGAILLSEKGELLWEWIVHENDLDWRLIANAERKFPHGILIDKDGSITFAFDNGNSLQKFDRCSQRVWAEHAKVDHSLSHDHKGNIWAVMGPDSLGLFSAKTGKRIKRINMKRLMKKNPLVDPLGIRQIDASKRSRFMTKGGGYWHPNDVEPLPKAYLKAFPQFELGDLLVSLRSLNLVFVFSPEDLKIKWWRSGAWRRQHDPDWQADGTITVFNNNMHNDVSTVVRIDPKTYEHETAYDGSKEKFYTWMRGKHEFLPNGHLILSSPQQGRVFELDSNGEVVFEFVNRYDEQKSMLVSELLTLPLDYFEQNAFESCQKVKLNQKTKQNHKIEASIPTK